MNSLAAAKVPINSPKQLKKKSPIKSNSVVRIFLKSKKNFFLINKLFF